MIKYLLCFAGQNPLKGNVFVHSAAKVAVSLTLWSDDHE